MRFCVNPRVDIIVTFTSTRNGIRRIQPRATVYDDNVRSFFIGVWVSLLFHYILNQSRLWHLQLNIDVQCTHSLPDIYIYMCVCTITILCGSFFVCSISCFLRFPCLVFLIPSPSTPTQRSIFCFYFFVCLAVRVFFVHTNTQPKRGRRRERQRENEWMRARRNGIGRTQ